MFTKRGTFWLVMGLAVHAAVGRLQYARRTGGNG